MLPNETIEKRGPTLAFGGTRFLVLSIVVLLFCSDVAFASDWWRVEPLAMPVRPINKIAAIQNPPLFSWPVQAGVDGYELQIASDLAAWETYRCKDNWFHPRAVLTSGTYRWRVRFLGKGGGPPSSWSDERRFIIDSNSQAFVVDDASVLWHRASQKAHPRSFPIGEEFAALGRALAAERAPDILVLKNRLKNVRSINAPVEPSQRFDRLPTSAAKNKSIADVRNSLNVEQELILSLGLLWRFDGDRKWLDAAKQRTLNLARWDPDGSTGLVSHTQASRTILFTLAVAYDWFYQEWSVFERKQILESVHVRYAALYKNIVGNGSLASRPFNSFNSYTLGYLVAVAPMLAGEMQESEVWFREAFGLYLAVFPAWSGDDGGYANGTTYGVYDVPESIVLLDALRWSTGFDLYQKPAIHNFGKLMAYFLPPGTPEGLFGDGAEDKIASSLARYGKSFAARAPSSLMSWYSRQLFGENRTSFVMLTAPPLPVYGSSRFPPKTPDAIHFESVGWVAMHSSLEDRSRISVYFKSSPFGSFNHSHADQNSFVIHAHGRVLAMDSGFYDYYNSPHWRNWYKQTRAHNAITYDGGQGQSLGEDGTGSKGFAGSITKFVHTPEADWVTGDAANAFEKPLTRAERSLIFIRPSTLVVVDDLAAETPKHWEWNLHTPTALLSANAGWEMQTDGAGMCMNFESSAPVVHTSSMGYSPKPEIVDKPQPHVWSVFGLKDAAKSVIFVTVLRMDCTTPAPQILIDEGNVRVKVAGKVVTHQAGATSVQ